MIPLAVVLFILALILILGSQLWLVILAFQRHILWGLGTLFIPGAALVFIVLAWAESRRAFFLGVAGTILALAGFFLLPREVFKEKIVAQITRQTESLRHAKPGVSSAPELSLDEKLARLRLREQELIARKAALKPGDGPALEAITREIAQYNLELQPVLLALSQRKAGDGLWRDEAVGAAIPKEPAAGRVHGRPFTVETANLENGILSLRQGREFVAEQEWVIFLFLKKGESPANRLFEVKRKAGSSAAHVHLKWRE
ncbi:MAG: hypothetical protein JWL90_4385, partial [Chthoniobacteraceae bacterium]|nr:hypothetical protein [Chthoniobacteraceae bacterium]